jgi:hypothetical protein
MGWQRQGLEFKMQDAVYSGKKNEISINLDDLELFL